jgi:hypothetical protein
MSQGYKLAENVVTTNNKGCFNIYITKDSIYCVPIDNYTPELKRLSKIGGALGGVGGLLGIVGIFLISIPTGIFISPRYSREKGKALDKLRNISIQELEKLKGYSCLRHEVEFEKTKKESYKVHIGKDSLLLTKSDVASLHKELIV